MANKDQINQEIEKTLNSIEGISRAAGNPFLFTRIKARMQPKNGWEQIGYFINRPVVALSLLVLVIAVNAWVLVSNNSTVSETNGISVMDIADEYNLAATTNYDYEKITNE